MELAQIIYDFDADPKPPEAPKTKHEVAQPQWQMELYNEAIRENMLALSNFKPADWMPGSGKQRDLMKHATKVFTDFVTKPAITAPFNASTLGPRRKVNFLKRSFGELREVRRAFGGTINEVVLTVVSAGMARYLSHRNQSVDNKHMRVMCPANVRTEDMKGALGNQVSAIFPLLPAWPMSPRDRLTAVCAEMDNIKSNNDAQAMTLATGHRPQYCAPGEAALEPTYRSGFHHLTFLRFQALTR